MIIGGGPEDESNATGSTSVIDMTVPAPRFRPGAAMSLPRMHLNAVLLPDPLFLSGGALAREDREVARRSRRSTTRPPTRGGSAPLHTSSACTTPSRCCCPTAGSSHPAGTRPPTVPGRVGPQRDRGASARRLQPASFAGPRPAISAVPTEWGLRPEDRHHQPSGWGREVAEPHPLRLHHPRLRQLAAAGRHGDPRAGWRECGGRAGRADLAPPGWYMLFLVDRARVPPSRGGRTSPAEAAEVEGGTGACLTRPAHSTSSPSE